MVHLLSRTSIFVALPNACFRQIAGVPIYNLDELPKRASRVSSCEGGIGGRRSTAQQSVKTVSGVKRRRETSKGNTSTPPTVPENRSREECTVVSGPPGALFSSAKPEAQPQPSKKPKLSPPSETLIARSYLFYATTKETFDKDVQPGTTGQWDGAKGTDAKGVSKTSKLHLAPRSSYPCGSAHRYTTGLAVATVHPGPGGVGCH